MEKNSEHSHQDAVSEKVMPGRQQSPPPFQLTANPGQTVIQRQETEGEATEYDFRPPQEDLDALEDRTVSDSIQSTLRSYQNIPITVSGIPSSEEGCEPERVTRNVTVSAVYHINSPEAAADTDRRAEFTRLGRGMGDGQEGGEPFSEMRTSGNGRRRRHNAAELGKASPQDIRAIVQQAVDDGTVLAWGRTNLPHPTADENLIDLDDAQIRASIQGWMAALEVGVDCSGFVVQAAYNARMAVRGEMEGLNEGLRNQGSERFVDVPEALDNRVQGAASFGTGNSHPPIAAPSDLRPGNTWVIINTGINHIRIVSQVRRVTNDAGNPCIEFDTAESTSATPGNGPTAQTWRTNSLTQFHAITKVRGDGGAGVGGNFFGIR